MRTSTATSKERADPPGSGSETSIMKILHVIYSFGIGGSESVAREVALNLQARSHENLVVALEHDGPLSAEFREHGIGTVVVDRANKSTTQAMKEVARACGEFQPDVIHTHHFYMLFYAMWGAVRHRVPVVHTEHEFWSLNTLKGKLFLPWLGRMCGRVTAVNEDTRAFMADRLHLPERKLVTVLNGIDLRRFNPQTSLRRADLGLADNDKVGIIVARLEPVKNHAMLIRAWQRVVEEVGEAKLLIVGEGSLGEPLKAQAESAGLKDNVLFLGPRRDVDELLPLADISLLSSLDEGLPMCLLEAMACELPVVATSVGGVPKLVVDGEHGRLVPSDDHDAMAGAVVGLFRDGAGCEAMGRNGHAAVEGTYDLESSVDRYEEMYYELKKND